MIQLKSNKINLKRYVRGCLIRVNHKWDLFLYKYFSKGYKFNCIFYDHLCQECYERWCLIEDDKDPRYYCCSSLKFKWRFKK